MPEITEMTEKRAENKVTVTLDRTQLELVEGDITDLDAGPHPGHPRPDSPRAARLAGARFSPSPSGEGLG